MYVDTFSTEDSMGESVTSPACRLGAPVDADPPSSVYTHSSMTRGV
jgi:hypothetical protein